MKSEKRELEVSSAAAISYIFTEKAVSFTRALHRIEHGIANDIQLLYNFTQFLHRIELGIINNIQFLYNFTQTLHRIELGFSTLCKAFGRCIHRIQYSLQKSVFIATIWLGFLLLLSLMFTTIILR